MSEAQAILRQILGSERHRLMDVFKRMDTDDSGTIDRKEWTSSLFHLGVVDIPAVASEVGRFEPQPDSDVSEHTHLMDGVV